ncbi:MAG: terminase TerL endonuclease subunit [Candidatus Caccovivens sp.]
MISWITDYCEYVKHKRPQDFGQDMHQLVKLIEKLLKRKDIEYKESDPIMFEKFCRLLKHKEGEWAGKSFLLNQEQKFIAASFLGIKTYSKTHNMWLRYFRELNIFVARKWGKTLFISALALWFLGFDKEPGAYGTVLAENARQAKKLYDLVCRASKDPVFKDIFKEFKKEEVLRCLKNEGEFTYLSGREKGKDGDNNSFFILDEAHEVTNYNQYTSKVTGQGARRQPVAIVISTAGVVLDSVYEKLLERNKAILSKSKFEDVDRVLPVIYDIDETDNPTDSRCWIKANPSMIEGRPTLEFLQGQFYKMKDDPIMYSQFLSKHLNRQIGASISYFDMPIIKKAASKFETSQIIDSYAVAGLDLSETTDLCNATLLILGDDAKFRIIQAYFIAQNCLERNSKNDKENYQVLTCCPSDVEIIKKLVVITPGNYVNQRSVLDWFCSCRDDFKINILKLGYDPWMSKEIVNIGPEYGFVSETITKNENGVEVRDFGIFTPVRQGPITLSPAIKITKSLFNSGQMLYDKTNKLLPYCFYNLKVKIDTNNNLSPHKSKSTGHIDGAMGIFMAFVAYERAKPLYEAELPQYFQI